MFVKKRLLSFLGLSLLLVTLIAGAGLVYANTPVRTPDGFSKVLVYMAAGKYDPTVPPAEGDLAMWFHKGIMGRSDEEIEDEKQAAMEYFESQFGVTFDDDGLPEPMPFGVDPRNEYRVYYISGMDVPSEGWVVRDGGFMVIIPEDMMLHGEWGSDAGKWVPAGSFLVYGDYNIDVTGPGKSGKRPAFVEPIIIHYESAEPIVPDEINGVTTFRCTVIGPMGEEGIAQGISKPLEPENGMRQANIRNILTFPPFGPSIVHET